MAEVAVVGVPDEAKGELLVAYVTLVDARAEPIQRGGAQGLLPRPDRVVQGPGPVLVVGADTLPRTDTGKLSRGAVRDLAAQFMAESTPSASAPTDDGH